MNFNLENLQQVFSEARQRYEELRRKMSQIEIEATAGAGMVTVRMNGEKMLLAVRIDPEVARNDPDMIADLVRSAVNDASRRVDERLRSELGSIIPGMPGLF